MMSRNTRLAIVIFFTCASMAAFAAALITDNRTVDIVAIVVGALTAAIGVATTQNERN